jgi:hypothetical protein
MAWKTLKQMAENALGGGISLNDGGWWTLIASAVGLTNALPKWSGQIILFFLPAGRGVDKHPDGEA